MDILDAFFPKFCLGCSKAGVYICEPCFKGFRPAYAVSYSAFSLWKYQGVVKKAISALKYKFAYDLSQELGEKVASRLKRIKFYSRKFTLVPIPLHPKRKRWRGFNQAEEVGSVVARQMGWRFLPDLIIKARETKPQVGLSGGERKVNIRGVFVVNPKYKRVRKDSLILLFDDVWTTGSTMTEADRVLKNTGFKKIYGLTIAR